MSGQIPEQRPGRATAGVPGGSSVYGASARTGSQGLATVAAAVDPTCERGEEKSVVEVGVNASGMPFSGPAGTHAPSLSRHSPPGRVRPGQRRATLSGTGRHMIDEGQWEGWLVVDRLEGRISVSANHQEPSSVVASSVAREAGSAATSRASAMSRASMLAPCSHVCSPQVDHPEYRDTPQKCVPAGDVGQRPPTGTPGRVPVGGRVRRRR